MKNILNNAFRFKEVFKPKKLFIFTLSFLILFLSFPSIKPLNIYADEVCSTEIVTDPYGNTYCMPSNIKGSIYESDYRNVVNSGRFDSTDRELFERLYQPNNLHDYLSTSFDVVWTSLQNGTIGKSLQGSFNCLLGGNWQIGGCSIEPQPESPNKNYYTGSSSGSSDSNKVFNQGNTINNSFYNPTTNQFTIYEGNTINNYDIKNYYYNFVNNTYNYTTIENNTFITVNNFNNTVINKIDNGVENGSYTYYFKLPDGSNSYNLTEDDIKGLRLDFNVKNYDDIQDNDSLNGLWHFDGNKKDSAYQSSSNGSFNIEPNTITYLTDNGNFGSYLYIGQGNNTITLDISDSNTVDFRFFPQYSQNFNLNINDLEFSKKDTYVTSSFDTTSTTTGTQTIITQVSYLSFSSSADTASSVCGSGGTRLSSKVSLVNQVHNPDNTYSKQYQHMYTCQYKVSNNTSTTSKVYNNNLVVNENENSKFIRFNEWNHIALSRNGDNLDIYINGVNRGSIPYSSTITFSLEQLGYSYFDELRMSKLNLYNGNFNPPSLPYDTNLIYVLPDTDSNNTILVQSLIPINDWQIGGVRSSAPSTGDIYVFVDENGLMKSMQQYDGSDWISVKGSLYSVGLGKWVSYYGYSVYLGNWDYVDTDDITVDDIQTNTDFYSWLNNWFNKFISKLDELIQAIKSISFGDITNLPGTNIWDFLTTVVESIGNGLSTLFGSITDFVKYLLVPDDSSDFTNSFTNTIHNVEDKLGFVGAPVTVFETVLNSAFNTSTNAIDEDSSFNFSYSPNISWSDVNLFDTTIIQGGSFNLKTDVLDKSESISNLYDIYLIVVDVIIYSFLLNLAVKKVRGIIK